MIETYLNNFNLNITKKEVETFKLYLDILQEWNSKINITSIKSYDDIIIKHLIDSLAVIKYIDINGKIVDVGSGGGFPGVPLKIMIPSLQVTLIEAKRKKANFLRFAIRELMLCNIDVYNGRAENFEKKFFFDYSISRAFSDIESYCILASQLVKRDGNIIAMLGKEDCIEKNNLGSLGFDIIRKISFDLPLERGRRTIVVLRKCST